MSQFLNHKDDGSFIIYYTRPHLSGTPEFEHAATVNMTDVVKAAKRQDGTDDPDTLEVTCPCGCGMVAGVPLLGGEEAQRLHARHKSHKEGKPYVTQAVAETMDLVRARGGEPRLDVTKG